MDDPTPSVSFVAPKRGRRQKERSVDNELIQPEVLLEPTVSTVSQPGSLPGSLPVSQPGSLPVSQPGSLLVSQPGSLPVSQPNSENEAGRQSFNQNFPQYQQGEPSRPYRQRQVGRQPLQPESKPWRPLIDHLNARSFSPGYGPPDMICRGRYKDDPYDDPFWSYGTVRQWPPNDYLGRRPWPGGQPVPMSAAHQPCRPWHRPNSPRLKDPNYAYYSNRSLSVPHSVSRSSPHPIMPPFSAPSSPSTQGLACPDPYLIPFSFTPRTPASMPICAATYVRGQSPGPNPCFTSCSATYTNGQPIPVRRSSLPPPQLASNFPFNTPEQSPMRLASRSPSPLHPIGPTAPASDPYTMAFINSIPSVVSRNSSPVSFISTNPPQPLDPDFITFDGNMPPSQDKPVMNPYTVPLPPQEAERSESPLLILDSQDIRQQAAALMPLPESAYVLTGHEGQADTCVFSDSSSHRSLARPVTIPNFGGQTHHSTSTATHISGHGSQADTYVFSDSSSHRSLARPITIPNFGTQAHHSHSSGPSEARGTGVTGWPLSEKQRREMYAQSVSSSTFYTRSVSSSKHHGTSSVGSPNSRSSRVSRPRSRVPSSGDDRPRSALKLSSSGSSGNGRRAGPKVISSVPARVPSPPSSPGSYPTLVYVEEGMGNPKAPVMERPFLDNPDMNDGQTRTYADIFKKMDILQAQLKHKEATQKASKNQHVREAHEQKVQQVRMQEEWQRQVQQSVSATRQGQPARPSGTPSRKLQSKPTRQTQPVTSTPHSPPRQSHSTPTRPSQLLTPTQQPPSKQSAVSTTQQPQDGTPNQKLEFDKVGGRQSIPTATQVQQVRKQKDAATQKTPERRKSPEKVSDQVTPGSRVASPERRKPSGSSKQAGSAKTAAQRLQYHQEMLKHAEQARAQLQKQVNQRIREQEEELTQLRFVQGLEQSRLRPIQKRMQQEREDLEAQLDSIKSQMQEMKAYIQQQQWNQMKQGSSSASHPAERASASHPTERASRSSVKSRDSPPASRASSAHGSVDRASRSRASSALNPVGRVLRSRSTSRDPSPASRTSQSVEPYPRYRLSMSSDQELDGQMIGFGTSRSTCSACSELSAMGIPPKASHPPPRGRSAPFRVSSSLVLSPEQTRIRTTSDESVKDAVSRARARAIEQRRKIAEHGRSHIIPCRQQASAKKTSSWQPELGVAKSSAAKEILSRKKRSVSSSSVNSTPTRMPRLRSTNPSPGSVDRSMMSHSTVGDMEGVEFPQFEPPTPVQNITVPQVPEIEEEEDAAPVLRTESQAAMKGLVQLRIMNAWGIRPGKAFRAIVRVTSGSWKRCTTHPPIKESTAPIWNQMMTVPVPLVDGLPLPLKLEIMDLDKRDEAYAIICQCYLHFDHVKYQTIYNRVMPLEHVEEGTSKRITGKLRIEFKSLNFGQRPNRVLNVRDRMNLYQQQLERGRKKLNCTPVKSYAHVETRTATGSKKKGYPATGIPAAHPPNCQPLMRPNSNTSGSKPTASNTPVPKPTAPVNPNAPSHTSAGPVNQTPKPALSQVPSTGSSMEAKRKSTPMEPKSEPTSVQVLKPKATASSSATVSVPKRSAAASGTSAPPAKSAGPSATKTVAPKSGVPKAKPKPTTSATPAKAAGPSSAKTAASESSQPQIPKRSIAPAAKAQPKPKATAQPKPKAKAKASASSDSTIAKSVQPDKDAAKFKFEGPVGLYAEQQPAPTPSKAAMHDLDDLEVEEITFLQVQAQSEGQKEEMAATRIQAVHRGNVARRELVQQSKEEEAAAAKIQAAYRGKQARRRTSEVSQEFAESLTDMRDSAHIEEQELAATKIQAIYRGNVVRSQKGTTCISVAPRDPLQEETVAATRIQAAYRGNVARRAMGSGQGVQGQSVESEDSVKAESVSSSGEDAFDQVRQPIEGHLSPPWSPVSEESGVAISSESYATPYRQRAPDSPALGEVSDQVSSDSDDLNVSEHSYPTELSQEEEAAIKIQTAYRKGKPERSPALAHGEQEFHIAHNISDLASNVDTETSNVLSHHGRDSPPPADGQEFQIPTRDSGQEQGDQEACDVGGQLTSQNLQAHEHNTEMVSPRTYTRHQSESDFGESPYRMQASRSLRNVSSHDGSGPSGVMIVNRQGQKVAAEEVGGKSGSFRRSG